MLPPSVLQYSDWYIYGTFSGVVPENIGLSPTLKLIVALFISTSLICWYITVLGFIVFIATTKSFVPEFVTLALLTYVSFTITFLSVANVFSSFALREILYI